MIISPTGQKQWTNRHETFTQNIENLYDLGNNNTGSVLNDYNDTTAGIQGIIQQVINANKRLRPLGGGWSWTKIAATDGIILNTKQLNLAFKITPANISPNYQKTADDLYFAQCGISVQELNNALRKRNRSLKTSGASTGQTIAGAISTGTHGSAIDIGAMQDFVVGLHIIVSPTRHVWLERSSYPVVSDSFVSKLNAELIRNDDLFNAALVSFGSFGFIHGVMLETEPLFLYECYRQRMALNNDLFHIMETLDFANASLPHGSERPFHFQLLVNQYDLDKGAYANIMYKRPFNPAYTPPSVSVPGISPGDDAPAFIGTLTQSIPALVPSVVNLLINNAYKPYADVWGTHGEIFTNTDTHGKVLSVAIGVPLNEVLRVKDLLLSLNNTKGPFAGVFTFRYVKGTKATLGFTHFNPTCIIEMDGVFSKNTSDFYYAVWNSLDALNISYTFHWGKVLELDSARLRRMYGNNNVDAWITSRNTLMKDTASMNVFTNDLMTELGLDAKMQSSKGIQVSDLLPSFATEGNHDLLPLLASEGNHEKTDDQLEFTNDIESFAKVISMKNVKPPLAIGLFGNWGSGKSFFMEKLYEKINKLCGPKRKNYVEHVVHVKFNSWHYSDANLWASLVTKIFDSLHDFAQGSSYKTDQLYKLTQTLEITKKQKEEAELKKATLEEEKKHLEIKQKQSRDRLEDISGIELLKLVLGNEKVKNDLSELDNNNIEKIITDRNKIEGYIKEVKDYGNQFNYCLETLTEFKAKRWLFVLLIASFVFVVSYLVMNGWLKNEFDLLTKNVSSVIAGVTAFVAALINILRPAFKIINQCKERLKSLKDTIDRRPVKESKEINRIQNDLVEINEELTLTNKKINEVEQEISDILSGKKLFEFVGQRSKDEKYLNQLGLISWIRKDFERLDELLRMQHDAKEKSERQEKGNPIQNPLQITLKIDRIILYIDDLDRCNEEIVVKVLEAIHLLLAIPLFVVIVGVDPRWLNNAINEKYKTLFGLNKDTNHLKESGNNNGKDTENKIAKVRGKKIEKEFKNEEESKSFLTDIATSFDYLEKIFQVPFRLKPINKDGREDLIGYLLEKEMTKKDEAATIIDEKGNSEGGQQTLPDTKVSGKKNSIETTVNREGSIEGQSDIGRPDNKNHSKEATDDATELTFTEAEVDLMKEISVLFGQSPRTINRYINIYRIIKSHKGFDVSSNYSFADYAPTLLILGIIVGYSAFAQQFINSIQKVKAGKTFEDFLNGNYLEDELKKILKLNMNQELKELDMANYKKNIGLVSRFSFRTII